MTFEKSISLTNCNQAYVLLIIKYSIPYIAIFSVKFIFFIFFRIDINQVKTMRLFKRRCSDPSPQLVSLSPIEQDQKDLSAGFITPKGCITPENGSPKPHKKSNLPKLLHTYNPINYL